MFQTSRRCYCAFCRSERIVYKKKHVSAVDAGMALFATVLLSFLIWQDFDPRSVFLFVISLGLAEFFIIFRWRLSIACPHCGFDPVVYKKNRQMAADRVKAHMSQRREDPLWLFNPPPKLPNLVRTRQPVPPPSRDRRASP
jgi:hypothetical protein